MSHCLRKYCSEQSFSVVRLQGNSGSAIPKVDDCKVSRVMIINTRELTIVYLTRSISKGGIKRKRRENQPTPKAPKVDQLHPPLQPTLWDQELIDRLNNPDVMHYSYSAIVAILSLSVRFSHSAIDSSSLLQLVSNESSDQSSDRVVE